MNAVIFGPPGSGKGTYASRLQSKLGLDAISTGDVLREIAKEETQLGKAVRGYQQSGQLVPDDITIEVLKQRLARIPAGRGFILDGYPRTIEQAKALEKIAKIDVIILLVVPEQLIIERLSARRMCRKCGEIFNLLSLKPKVEGVCDKCGGPLYQRSDDTLEVVKGRIKVYEEQTEPIVELFKERKVPFVTAGCTELNTPPEKIVDVIMGKLRKQKLV